MKKSLVLKEWKCLLSSNEFINVVILFVCANQEISKSTSDTCYIDLTRNYKFQLISSSRCIRFNCNSF